MTLATQASRKPLLPGSRRLSTDSLEHLHEPLTVPTRQSAEQLPIGVPHASFSGLEYREARCSELHGIAAGICGRRARYCRPSGGVARVARKWPCRGVGGRRVLPTSLTFSAGPSG
jgi:hypothetical protein